MDFWESSTAPPSLTATARDGPVRYVLCHPVTLFSPNGGFVRGRRAIATAAGLHTDGVPEKLMFYYKNRFMELRKASHIVLAFEGRHGDTPR